MSTAGCWCFWAGFLRKGGQQAPRAAVLPMHCVGNTAARLPAPSRAPCGPLTQRSGSAAAGSSTHARKQSGSDSACWQQHVAVRETLWCQALMQRGNVEGHATRLPECVRGAAACSSCLQCMKWPLCQGYVWLRAARTSRRGPPLRDTVRGTRLEPFWPPVVSQLSCGGASFQRCVHVCGVRVCTCARGCGKGWGVCMPPDGWMDGQTDGRASVLPGRQAGQVQHTQWQGLGLAWGPQNQGCCYKGSRPAILAAAATQATQVTTGRCVPWCTPVPCA